MRFGSDPPKNNKDFEQLCLLLLRRHWNAPQLQLYAHDGESQYGVDIHDPFVSAPHRAAQCKLHDAAKTIPPKEIRDEVDKALGYAPPLDHYVILTTGKASRHADDEVKTLNQSLRDRGRFRVELWTWNRIEELLDEHPDVKDGLYKTLSGQAVERLDNQLALILARIEVPVGPSADALDAELDDAKRELDRHDAGMARRILDRLLTRQAARLSPRQTWRAKTLLANTRLWDGDLEAAGRLLLEAVRHQPNEEKARINAAAGHELCGERARAHAAADALRGEFPHSMAALAVWIRTAPGDATPDLLEREAGRHAETNEEVALALAARLNYGNHPGPAERFARAASAIAPDAPHGWLLLGQAVHQRTMTDPVRPDRADRLRTAVTHYDRAVELMETQGPRHLRASAHLNRGILREFLEALEPAGDDYREAIRLAPDAAHRADATVQYVTYLSRRDRHDDAVQWAGRVRELDRGGRGEVLYAAALYDRDANDDRSRAVDIWCAAVSRGSSGEFGRAAAGAVLGLCQLGRPAEARTLLAGIPPDRLPPAVRNAFDARVALAEGARAEAVALAWTAASGCAGTRPEDRFFIAQLLVLLDLHAEAVPVLTPVVRPGLFDDPTRLLLDCAARAEDHGLTLRLCRELREAGVTDPRLRRQEFELRSVYEPHAAAELVHAYLADHPGDRLARLQLALLGVRCERPEWAPPDLTELPLPEEAHPATVGVAVLGVLMRGSRTLDALHFAYSLVRAHPGNPDAHLAYLHLFFQGETAEWPLDDPPRVDADAAVRFRDCGTGKEEWLVIEPGTPNPLLGEAGPDDPRVRPMLGRRVGEQFPLTAGVQPRWGEVVAIQSKYVYRFEECRDSYETRFRDRRDFQMVQVVQQDPDGTERVDLTPLMADHARREQYVAQLLEYYRTHPVPLHVLSHLLGRDLFETMDGLCDPRLGIQYFTGRDSEWTEDGSTFAPGRTLVLELTALFTIGRLGLAGRLGAVPGVTYAVAQATYEQLRDLATHHPFVRSRVRTASHGPDGFGWVEVPEEAARREQQFREGLLAWVRDRCQVVGCPELADLEPARRRSLQNLFGPAGAQSACLATRPSHTLWTDDLTLASIAREFFPGVRRTWTQAALSDAAEARHLDNLEYCEATARLIGWGYGATRIGPEVLHRAAALAGWSPRGWPFDQALRYFRKPDVTATVRVHIAAGFLYRVVRWENSQYIREAVVGATLTSMPRDLVRSLALALDVASEGDAARELHRLVVRWLRQSWCAWPDAWARPGQR